MQEAAEIEALSKSQSTDLKHTLSEEDKHTDVSSTKKPRTSFMDHSVSKKSSEDGHNVPSKTVTFVS